MHPTQVQVWGALFAVKLGNKRQKRLAVAQSNAKQVLILGSVCPDFFSLEICANVLSDYLFYRHCANTFSQPFSWNILASRVLAEN